MPNLKKSTLIVLVAVITLAGATAPCVGHTEPRQSVLSVDGAQFAVSIAPGDLDLEAREVNSYVKDAARAVIAYYGSFPVARTVVKVTPTDDDGVGFATSTHEDRGGYGLIEINLGANTTRRDLDRSWTLTHEMMHLAFPISTRRHRWIPEGIATYIEPIGRMRVGKITREEMWQEFVENIGRGLPRNDDGGLNHASNFGRIYWGGALYCLLSDVEIRKQTRNKLGLEHALRGIAKRGGNAASDWSMEKALRVGDETVGLSVLQDYYGLMSETPMSTDIQKLLKDLGIRRSGKSISFDERAPLAHVRRAIEGHDTGSSG